jgi:hypothetical protein
MTFSSRLRVVLASLGFLVLLCSFITGLPFASAQTPPLFPPPFPWINESAPNPGVGSIDDRKPPLVEVITTHLNHGKNVLIVKITDESFIMSRQVKYVHDGRIAFADLARDHDNVYYALINVEPPSSIVEIDVIDSANNRAIIVEEIPVGPPASFYDIVGRVLTLINNMVTEVTNTIGSLGR